MPATTDTTGGPMRGTALRMAASSLAVVGLLLVTGCRPPSLEYPAVKPAPPQVQGSGNTTGSAGTSMTPTSSVAPASVATDGLKPVFSNPTFDSGLSTWVVYDFKPATSPGTNVVELVPVVGRSGQSLHVARTSEQDSGGSGVTQRISLDCSRFSTLRASFSASVSFGTGANMAGFRTGVAADAPVMVSIKYVDTSGKDREYYHGLYAGPVSGADAVHFQQIGQGQWVSWVSPNLMDLPDKPKRITEVTFSGRGSAFDSLLDDCQLWSGL